MAENPFSNSGVRMLSSEKVSIREEFLKAIKERRSVRRYEREPVSLDDLKVLVDAAR